MEQNAVISFFDQRAAHWDEHLVRNEEVIAAILDNGGIFPGIHLLDVACGTGVLFPDYLSRRVASLTAIDVSPEMVKRAKQKFPDIEVICGDAQTYPFDRQFDAIMIYNAFPHFPDPAALIEAMAKLLVPGGRLSVAHGMSREKLSAHHSGEASGISRPLPDAQALADLFAEHFEVAKIISDDRMYQVVGIKKPI